MKNCLITGSGGLVGSEATQYFSKYFDIVYGIDNDTRKNLFNTSVQSQIDKNKQIGNYVHIDVDIRDIDKIPFPEDIDLIIHCAAQPSHDWATNNVIEDFEINTTGTVKLMECIRKYTPLATTIFVSTNKVYGDYPNHLGYTDNEKRFNPISKVLSLFGFNENTPIDNVKHSFFGCSKSAADLYVQEYGKYFGMKTGIFRCGCITGSNHSGAKLHGFLAYLVKCAKENLPYTIIGYNGMQVRDNIHAYDLVTAFHEFYKNPKCGEVYNMGGGVHSNCSVIEAIEIIKEVSNIDVEYSFNDNARIGDHKWWISDVTKFRKDFPNWEYKYNIYSIIKEMVYA